MQGPHRQDRDDEIKISQIAAWLARAATRGGLSGKKVLDSPLDLSSLPPEWNRLYSAARFVELICDCARNLPDGDSQIALTALNQYFAVTGATLTDRFKGLCTIKHQEPSVTGRQLASWRSAANRWRDIRPNLALRIQQALQERVENGWGAGHFAGADPEGRDLQPFVVERLEVTYFFDQHGAFTHSITERWLSAELPTGEEQASIDHYKVRARYTDRSIDENAQQTEIIPLLNCRLGRTEVGQDGWLMTEMLFPEPVRNGGKVFFASLVRSAAEAPTAPLVYIQVTSYGIVRLVMRLQFHANATPRACWVYRGVREPDRESAPDLGDRDRWRIPSSLGYVEHVAENCPPSWYYAVGWTWE
jgi:hypothetical protein